ncbi:hypothetical protein D932_00581 [Enterococcus casseliflavus 14-MB-W-14]|nr:hypothetical protein D932_00581 [Enterococcus casseliflavus 14-MB-W-14]
MNLELDQFRDVDLVIDYANYSFIEKQFVSQGDYKGRTLTVQVTNNGVIGEVPGLMLNLNWHNEASGLTDLSAFSVLNKANSIYRIEYPQHMMTPGRVIASIQVIQNGKVTNLKQFQLTVQELAGQPVGIVEKAEFSALVAVLADANEFRTDINATNINLANGLSNKVDKNGNEQITMPMLSQSVKEAMTGGSVAVVGEGAVSTTNIAENAVTEPKIVENLSEVLLSQGRNLLKNTTFQNGTNSWASASTPSATLTANQNQQTLRVTGTGTAENPMVYQNLDALDIKKDHTYYFCSMVNVSNSDCKEIRTEFCNNTFPVYNPVSNQIYRLDGVQKLISETYRSFNLRHIYADASSASGKEMIVGKPIVVDLTVIFGVGNEPTLEECRWLFESYTNYFEEGKVFFSASKTVTKKILETTQDIATINNGVDLTEIPINNVFPNARLNNNSFWVTTSIPDTTVTAANGVLTLTGNGSVNTQRAFVNYNLKAGNFYFLSMKIKTKNRCNKISITQASVEVASIVEPEIDKWHTVEIISSDLSENSIYIRTIYDSAEEANGAIVQMTEPILIDLTIDFPNPPNINQLKNILAYTGNWFFGSASISKSKYAIAVIESKNTSQEQEEEINQSIFYNTINRIPDHDGSEAIDIEELTTETFYPMWDTLINSTSYLEKVILGKDQSNTWDIWQVKTMPVAPKYKLLVTCNVHGHGEGGDPRDVGVSLYYFIKDLVQNPTKSSQLEWLYNNVQIIFIPVANPSGFNLTGRYNSRGVDINRNFDYNFPDNPSSVYGTEPFSEVESQYIRDMVLDNIDADGFIDIHCFMNNPISLLYPAYSVDTVGIGWKTLNEVATHMEKKYGGTRSITVTNTSGTIRMWVEKENGIEAITPEGTVYITGETPHSSLGLTRLTEWYGNNIYRFIYTIPWNKDYFVSKKGSKFVQIIDENGILTPNKIN